MLLPPKDKAVAAVVWPAYPDLVLPVIIVVEEYHVVPSYTSVKFSAAAACTVPAKATAELEEAPAAPPCCLPNIIVPPTDQVDPLYFSVVPKKGPPAVPPIAKASFCIPAPAKPPLAVIIEPPAVQDAPLYASVHATIAKVGVTHPPKYNAAFCVPAPPAHPLAVIKAPPADQLVPSYSSVQVICGKRLPIAKAAVWIPTPAPSDLLLIIELADAQVDPLYFSVLVVGEIPPKANAADVVPAPFIPYLADIRAPLDAHVAGTGIKGTYIWVGVFATGLEAVNAIWIPFILKDPDGIKATDPDGPKNGSKLDLLSVNDAVALFLEKLLLKLILPLLPIKNDILSVSPYLLYSLVPNDCNVLYTKSLEIPWSKLLFAKLTSVTACKKIQILSK